MVRETKERHRRTIRLRGFDYTRPGWYFLTICTKDRACLFGDVRHGQVQLNRMGKVAEACWLGIPDHFPTVELDAFIVMPNHVHGIVRILPAASQPSASQPSASQPSASQTAASQTAVGANDYSPLPIHRLTIPRLPIDRSERPAFRSPSKTVGSVVRGFKIGVTHWIRANTDVRDVWQRNYYEHIIRDARGVERIRRYIADNPSRWGGRRE